MLAVLDRTSADSSFRRNAQARQPLVRTRAPLDRRIRHAFSDGRRTSGGLGKILVQGGRGVRFVLVLVASLIAFGLPHLLWIAVHPRRTSPFSRLFLRSACAALGLRVKRTGAILPRRGLTVANHVSWTDVIVMGAVLQTRFVAKTEVRRWPMLGALAVLNATVFVDRATRVSIRAQIEALRRALGDGLLVLFPEGTSSQGSTVLPFRSALFAAAAGHDVQPATIIYRPRNQTAWPPGGLAAFAWYGDKTFLPHLLEIVTGDSVDCEIVFHAPVGSTADRKTLAALCHAASASALPRT